MEVELEALVGVVQAVTAAEEVKHLHAGQRQEPGDGGEGGTPHEWSKQCELLLRPCKPVPLSEGPSHIDMEEEARSTSTELELHSACLPWNRSRAGTQRE